MTKNNKMDKWHKIEIKQKEGTEDTPMTGATTEFFLDGKRLKGVVSVNLDIQAGGMAKLQLEVLGNCVFDGLIDDVVQNVVPLVPEAKLPTCIKCSCKIVEKKGDTVCLDCWMGQ